jgi:hypothetical protein
MKVGFLLLTLALTAALACVSPNSAWAVSQWARRYNMPCSGCHSPYPRLNATGIAFKMNGYRFAPGENVSITSRNLTGWIGPTWGPSLTIKGGDTPTADGRNVRIHLGGPLGRHGAFLVQPTTGGSGDFNMAQGMLVFGSAQHRLRLVGGRLYAWSNGAGIGASDRFATISLPRMFGNLQGVQIGGLGHGARLEYIHNSDTMLSLFTSDMEATATRARTIGLSLGRRLDKNNSSAVELFWGRSFVPVEGQGDIQADRFGLLFSRALTGKQGREVTNLLFGMMYGDGDRPLRSGARRNLWTGFFEVDWSPTDRLTWVARQEWETRNSSGGLASGLMLGLLAQVTPNVRIDTEVMLMRPGYTSPQVLARVRLVY